MERLEFSTIFQCNSFTHKHTEEHISMHDWLGPWQQHGYISFKEHQHDKAALLQWLKHYLFIFFFMFYQYSWYKFFSLGKMFGNISIVISSLGVKLWTRNALRRLQEADPSDAESMWLTLSSQLQPRSSVPRDPTPEPIGLETSSGMVGRWVGALSRWFRLPWVPLLGAGFSPSRSGRAWCLLG